MKLTIAQAAERAKTLYHLQAEFRKQTGMDHIYPRFNAIEVAAKWLAGKPAKFSATLEINSSFEFVRSNDSTIVNHLTRLFAELPDRCSYEQIEELVKVYRNYWCFLEDDEVSHVQVGVSIFAKKLNE